MITSAVYTVCF